MKNYYGKEPFDLIKYVERSVSPYHVVENSRKMLEEAGFERLDTRKRWELKKGGRYYTVPSGSALVAFVYDGQPEGTLAAEAHAAQTPGALDGVDGKALPIHIAAAHTDFPCLHIKPVAELPGAGYVRLNCEVYGGPILNTWLDRPLSAAGRVMLKSDNVYEPREVLVDFGRPIVTIPNLAIHYNRDVNSGTELKKQNDMLPILGMIGESLNKDSCFIDALAEEIGADKEDILDFDIYIYNYDKAAVIGINGDMLSAPRLDNLTSCLALLKGIIGCDGTANAGGISMIALFDNEEIGSRTKQGADSELLGGILKRIYRVTGRDEETLEVDIAGGFLLSVDVAHAIHPAKTEKYDPVNNMRMGDGITLKLSINQRYSYDSPAVAALMQLCDISGVKYKKFVNNSDMAGGGTLGPIVSSHLPMRNVDIGVPLLAMHSARELMGIADQKELEKLMLAFL